MDPVAAWQSPLMHAYAYYIRINLRGSILRSRKSEIYLALALCNSMDEGISQPLKVVYSIRRNLPTGPMSDVSCSTAIHNAILVLLTFAFLAIGAPIDEHEARHLNTENITQREVAPAPAVSLVDSENIGWTVDGNNVGASLISTSASNAAFHLK
ncbi:hypothetical protein B0H13DRAFT_1954226 [Mycena leptocephala]|nr:hypothetical protein B0H13DRAFT_1954226 [Mycena leptocephala]